MLSIESCCEVCLATGRWFVAAAEIVRELIEVQYLTFLPCGRLYVVIYSTKSKAIIPPLNITTDLQEYSRRQLSS